MKITVLAILLAAHAHGAAPQQHHVSPWAAHHVTHPSTGMVRIVPPSGIVTPPSPCPPRAIC